MKITNIKWDTDGDEEVFATLPQEIDVPEYFLEKKNFEVDGEYSRDEMLDQLSDWLSDEYGFCHGGFDVEQEADMQYQLYARYGKKIMYGILSDYSRKEKKLKRIRRSTIPIGYIEQLLIMEK